MKKFLSFALIMTFALTAGCFARVQYDQTGRYIVKDNTIRGKKRAAQAEIQDQRRIKAAAAAKIDYEKALHELETQQYNKYNNLGRR